MTDRRFVLKRISLAALGLLFFLIGAEAHADPTCPAGQVGRWTVTNVYSSAAGYTVRCPQGTTFPTSGAAIATCAAQHGDGSGSGTHWSGINNTAYDGVSTVLSILNQYYHQAGAHSNNGGTYTINRLTFSCVTNTSQCSDTAGTARRIIAPSVPTGTFCFNNCNYSADSNKPVINLAGGNNTVRFGGVSAGTACQTNTPDTQAADASGTVTNGTDTLTGFDDAGQCGTINGEAVCLPSVPAGGCSVSVNAVCHSSATTPPTPDNGTPGQPAPIAGTVTTAGGTTYYVYNSSVVTNSSNYGPGACDPSVNNCDSGGNPDGTCNPATDPECREDGKGTISGGQTCSSPPSCNNDPIQCYHSTRLWELKCALATPTSSSLQTALDAGATDGLVKPNGQALVPKQGNDVNLSSWWQPQAASNACPEDFTVSLWIADVVIPISQWCGLLHTIGLFVLMAAALQAFRIFAQGVN